jgi:fructose/tagatose bisphosphate aldolase
LNVEKIKGALIMEKPEITRLLEPMENSLSFSDSKLIINNQSKLQANIHKLAEKSALGDAHEQGYARYLINLAALASGIVPSSIHELYIARGRNELPNTFTVPALNLRMIPFDTAKAVFRAAKALDSAAFIFEIARSEMGYTDQRPAEYVSSILAAAIAEGYQGPVFIQGDHFQVSASRYAANPEPELQALRDLIIESISAGFYNIDIDTSTLVDITKPTVPEQQSLNCTLSAMFTAFIREHQPEGITISIGGEIGEVGGHNSTEEELCAYMDGYQAELARLAPGAVGLSKISIQTGTSHGGVVLPDGSIAQVNVDFDTLSNLSRIARQEYHMGGAVQHGASTLPEDAFSKFVDSEAIEVHLATNFQNMVYDRLPANLKAEMYAYLDTKSSAERKPGMTDEQFYYKTRKNAIGPFKAKTWLMPSEHKAVIVEALETQFLKLFSALGVKGTREYVDKIIKPVVIQPKLKTFLGKSEGEEDVSDLAD